MHIKIITSYLLCLLLADLAAGQEYLLHIKDQKKSEGITLVTKGVYNCNMENGKRIKAILKGSFGYHIGSEAVGGNYNCGINVEIRKYILSAEIECAANLNDKEITTGSLLAGKIFFQDEITEIDVLIGFGFSKGEIWGVFNQNYGSDPIYLVSAPIQIDLWFRPILLSKYIGLGVCITGNVNSYMSYAGAMFSFRVGTMR